MSTMANTTPLVTTVTKPATIPRDAEATPRVNIQEFYEEYYEDILPIIMDKVRRARRKDVHTRLDFGEGLRERKREDSHHSSTRARTTKPERVKVQDRLRYGDRRVLERLGHRRQSAFDRLSETYSQSTTKSCPRGTDSRDPPCGRSRPHGLDTSKEDRAKDRERFHSVGESYDDSFSYSYRDGNRSRHMKRGRDNESPLSSVSRSDSNDGRGKSVHNSNSEFESSRRTRMPNNVKMYDGTGDPEDHVKIFQAAAQVERWAMPTWCHMFNSTLIWATRDPVEIHNIKQKDGETIEDFMERFKVKTGRMKGAPEYMRISRFMQGISNPKLTKRLNEHVPKTMEEMMITTTAFIRGEAAAARKKKGTHPGRHMITPKGKTQIKEILAAVAGKFQPPPPMVTLVEKWSSNKFCDFHNDKGHRTDECMQLKKQIKELVRAGKLSHLIKEIKQGRDQSKTGKKETTAKDKPTEIYMIQSWQRKTRQKVTQSFERVKEITFPPLVASSGTEGPLVIEVEIGRHMIHRMYVDGGSSMEILYEHCFNQIRLEIKSQMVPVTTSLAGFSGDTIWPLGQLRLLVIIGDADHFIRAWMNFMIVRSLSPYNGIIRRPGIRAIQAVPSTVHGMLKFPVKGGIVTIRSTVLIPTECTPVITSSAVYKEERTRPANFKVALHPDVPNQEVAIGGTLLDKGRIELCSILKKNLDIFAWQPSDMTRVPRSVTEHRLNIREGYSPFWQKKRDQAAERAKAIQAEVQKLVEAGIMREVYYHDWLSKPVMIQLAEPDEENTTFYTGQGVYYYTKMPFGLKNAGATYQRLIDKAFESQIGRNIKVYVDDLVVKSYTEAEIMRDIDETFRTLRKINMKLNPKKCSFGLAEGMFLGYVVTLEGIKSYPDKTAAVLRLPSPRTIKERKPTSRASGRNSAGAVDAFHRRLTCVDGSGVWLILTNPEGIEFTYALRFQFASSNNEAEYEALIAGLRIATRIGVKNVHVSIDSKLVANQVLGTYVAKEDNMVKYLEIVKSLEVATVIEEDEPTWMTSIVDYLKEGNLPGDKKEARKLRLRARQYELMEGVLYRGSFLTSWLGCVGLLQVEYVIREIHEGSCSMHAGPWSVVVKAIRLGYYCPTMHRDARNMIQKCNDCQIHRPITKSPQQPLTPIMAPWPFYKWGINIAGPFPKGPCKVKFLIAAMDYFKKWIEAKVVATITGGHVNKFVWDNIVCRFGIPGEIVSDNGKHFNDNPFKDWRDKLNITQWFASVKYPQSNGLVKRANQSLGEGIKSRLGEGNKNWVEELPHILWAHRTMIKSSHVDTPFSLTYRTEGSHTHRYQIAYVPYYSSRCANAKSNMTKYYNAWVCGVTFRPCDFVYRSNDASHAVAGGKLGLKWKGPYEVTEALGDGAYKLRSMDETILLRTWNIANLKQCYL
nr:reverse transcriptase domain-containing protein [Tanacetum cinerariifolium]